MPYERVPSVRKSPDNATVLSNLGLLGDLAGSWAGVGFNLIARPDAEGRASRTERTKRGDGAGLRNLLDRESHAQRSHALHAASVRADDHLELPYTYVTSKRGKFGLATRLGRNAHKGLQLMAARLGLLKLGSRLITST